MRRGKRGADTHRPPRRRRSTRQPVNLPISLLSVFPAPRTLSERFLSRSGLLGTRAPGRDAPSARGEASWLLKVQVPFSVTVPHRGFDQIASLDLSRHATRRVRTVS
jgi:hypothetical protein